MKKASEYLQHAKECRALALQAGSEDHRKQLMAMAETWDHLAGERAKLIRSIAAADVGQPSKEARVMAAAARS